MKAKSNKSLTFKKDPEKSYVYIYDKEVMVGILMWDYKKHEWVFER